MLLHCLTKQRNTKIAPLHLNAALLSGTLCEVESLVSVECTSTRLRNELAKNP